MHNNVKNYNEFYFEFVNELKASLLFLYFWHNNIKWAWKTISNKLIKTRQSRQSRQAIKTISNKFCTSKLLLQVDISLAIYRLSSSQVFHKKVFLKISQILHENTCARVASKLLNRYSPNNISVWSTECNNCIVL